jgi:hypothetical protein
MILFINRKFEPYFSLYKLIVLVILKILFFYQRPFLADEHNIGFDGKKEPVCIVIKNTALMRSIFTASIKDAQHEKNTNSSNPSFDELFSHCTAKKHYGNGT